MSQPERKTIICPTCGNVNPFAADECIKCGLVLEPIRMALNKMGEGVMGPPGVRLTEPPPRLPSLPFWTKSENARDYNESERFLIRSVGHKAEEIAARFLSQMNKRKVRGLTWSRGELVVDGERREHYFAELRVDRGARDIIAIRIAPIGPDLFVQYYNRTVMPRQLEGRSLFLSLVFGAGASFFMYLHFWLQAQAPDPNNLFLLYCAALFAVPAAIRLFIAIRNRGGKLRFFQSQDSTAFQLTVRAAIEEAIEEAGISKLSIQPVSYGIRRP